jgi:hypothetical protein
MDPNGIIRNTMLVASISIGMSISNSTQPGIFFEHSGTGECNTSFPALEAPSSTSLNNSDNFH